MTETEWENAGNPDPMLAFLGRSPKYARKLRLFAAACSRRVWAGIDALGRAAVEVAESYADGQVDSEVLRAARLACKGAGAQAAWYAAASNPVIAARNAAHSALSHIVSQRTELLAQTALLRDIFGPLPFRDLASDSVVDGAVVTLAQALYDERNEDGTLDGIRFKVLADALENAGCEVPELLAHCRGPGPHVRGCWVIDGLLLPA
jgi:hypothetical protein